MTSCVSCRSLGASCRSSGVSVVAEGTSCRRVGVPAGPKSWKGIPQFSRDFGNFHRASGRPEQKTNFLWVPRRDLEDVEDVASEKDEISTGPSADPSENTNFYGSPTKWRATWRTCSLGTWRRDVATRRGDETCRRDETGRQDMAGRLLRSACTRNWGRDPARSRTTRFDVLGVGRLLEVPRRSTRLTGC
jgi:hypothetical protein